MATHEKEVKSTCPCCGVGCGFVLQAENGQLVGLKPDPDYPVSRGTLRPKGATAHEFVYHPDRLKRPLLRIDGRLTPAGWEKAYGFIAAELERIIEGHRVTDEPAHERHARPSLRDHRTQGVRRQGGADVASMVLRQRSCGLRRPDLKTGTLSHESR